MMEKVRHIDFAFSFTDPDKLGSGKPDLAFLYLNEDGKRTELARLLAITNRDILRARLNEIPERYRAEAVALADEIAEECEKLNDEYEQLWTKIKCPWIEREKKKKTSRTCIG